MEPSTKKRKLAPKVNASTAASSQAAPSQYGHDQQTLTQNQHNAVNDAPLAERHDFESFARHLQDAAMLIQRQTERKPYAEVSVLLLSWEEDQSVNEDVASLEQVLQRQYHFATQQWQIPSVPNPSIKLGVQIASFLDAASPDQLLMIYYAGHGYLSSDGHMYWACNAREDAAKLKWDGVKCLIEDAQSDILLLLDTCAIPNPPTAGSHGVKQGIAACSPEHNAHDMPGRSFTSTVVEALHTLHNGRPFTVSRLFEEVLSQRQQQLSRTPSATSDGLSTLSSQAQLPILFTLTPGNSQNLTLAPLPSRVADSQNNGEASERHVGCGRDDHLIDPESAAGLRFDEARILVCTTFVGDASPDMSFFNQWLQQTPPLGSKITVEGMFLGPPTMLLISMPQSIWNVVQHDKVCCFLGYISSHNMLHLYERLVGPGRVRPSSKEVADGRILLEAREVAAGTPAKRQRDVSNRDRPYHVSTSKDRALRGDIADLVSQSTPPRPAFGHGTQKSEDDVADSAAEMQEAAEQLKALSHVRHRSDETVRIVDRLRANLAEHGPNAEHETTRQLLRPSDAGINDSIMPADSSSMPNSKAKGPRRATVKQETRCSQCSHAPFKDSSSLRKHIAAAHTRPFPCAFSFAGCTSTFGSKNEWKRHIASQHLCLQYYRCSACPQSAFEGKGSEFNRKDLFTQHLRRMHAPFQVKRAISQGDGQLHLEWEAHVKEMQQSCLVTRRRPPQQAACPKPDCRKEFGGMNAWDEWTEHVGRHMEKGEGPILGADELLTQWALDEGIIERKANGGGYRLCSNNGSFGSSQGSSGPMLDRNDSLTASFTDTSQLDGASVTESRVTGGDAADTSQVSVG